MVVYVAGAVARPGIYRLTPGSRVGDAVALAGGLVAGADPLAVNLAARVSDGDEVAVTKIGETVRARSNAPRGRPRRVKTLPTQAVNLNESDAQTLATVPGIGAALAERIVAVRDADGAFTTFDELLDVAGMTTSRLDRAQPYLSI